MYAFAEYFVRKLRTECRSNTNYCKKININVQPRVRFKDLVLTSHVIHSERFKELLPFSFVSSGLC